MSGYKRVSFYELCRLCASYIQKEKTHIFQDDGRKIQLQNKIQTCLSLTVNENDFLPKVVCSKCLEGLESCYAFQQECVSSEGMLSSYFRNFRWTEDFKKSGKVYIKDTKSSQSIKAEVSTTSNQENQIQDPLLVPLPSEIKHIDQHVDNINVPYYTLQLPTIVTNPQVINKPTTKTIDITQNKIIQSQAQANQQQNFNLGSLNLTGLKQTNNSNPLKQEILSNVVVNSNGEVINISQLYSDFDSVINQVNSNNNKLKKRKKKKEETIFLDDNIIKIDLTQNEETYEKPRKNPNTVTKYKIEDKTPTVIYNTIPTSEISSNNQNFNNFSTIFTQSNINIVNSNGMISNSNVIHSNIESSTINLNVLNQNSPDNANNNNNFNRNYVQNIPTSQNLTTISDQKLAPTILTICPENFPPEIISSTAVKNETKTHDCDVCKKSFKRREHLYQHMKLHTGYRPYRCESCHKAFMRKEHLLRHMTLHSGQKNYTCTVCDKNFSRRDNLLKHKKIHEKQTNFTCEFCQKQFVMKHYYLAHKMTHEDKCHMGSWDLIKTQ